LAKRLSELRLKRKMAQSHRKIPGPSVGENRLEVTFQSFVGMFVPIAPSLICAREKWPGLPALSNSDFRSIVSRAQIPDQAVAAIIENSQTALDTGTYDPSAPLEAATLPMGTGAIAGVPVRGAETVLGSGAVRGIKSGMQPQTVYRVVPEDVPAEAAFRPERSKGVYTFTDPAAAEEYQRALGGKIYRAQMDTPSSVQHVDDFSIEHLHKSEMPRGGPQVYANAGDSELYPRGQQLYVNDTNLIDPTTIAEHPSPFAETNSATAGIAPAATPTIRAYHGSPHDFDAIKAGTSGNYGPASYFHIAAESGGWRGYQVVQVCFRSH
jgi:hypothetical protein